MYPELTVLNCYVLKMFLTLSSTSLMQMLLEEEKKVPLKAVSILYVSILWEVKNVALVCRWNND